MTDARQPRPSAEEQMLQHVRQHRVGEPPASLDAFILATARREVPVRKPGLWQRWQKACQQPRWQVAFASLIGVAVIGTWVLRAPQQYPGVPVPARYEVPLMEAHPESYRMSYTAPHPALSAPAPAAPVGALSMPAQAEMFSDEVQAQVAEPPVQKATTKASKRAAAPARSLDAELREVLRLRDAGRIEAAADRLAALKQRYPKEDLPARLEALQRP